MTGNDVIKTRTLFSNEVINIYPTFTLYLLLNQMPNFNGSDDAMGRRMKITRYTSRFVEGVQDDYNINVFASDMRIEEKTNKYRHILMSMLVDRFDINYQFEMPEIIKTWTKYVMNDNNPYSEFFETRVQKEQDNFMNMNALRSEFKKFLQKEYNNFTFNMGAFKEHCIRKFGDPTPRYNNYRSVFFGYKLITRFEANVFDNRDGHQPDAIDP
jgi:phage/plasmid-associated DNA primase